MLRLFVAVDLPARLRDEVARMMSAEVYKARWGNPQQLHITLRFLGDVPEVDLPRLQQGLSTVATAAFRLQLRGTGVFPTPREGKRHIPAKVLWLGIVPAADLERLRQAVDAALAGLRLGTATRAPQPYSPHLTLARFAGLPDHTLSHFLSRYEHYSSAPWDVTSFHLYQSVLRREGALHTRLGTYSLATNGGTE